MGYIEDLRQQAEVVRLSALHEQQQKDQERVFHEQRRKRAEDFWEESGVGSTIEEIESLLQEVGKLSARPKKIDKYDSDYGRVQKLEEALGAASDVDSKRGCFFWTETPNKGDFDNWGGKAIIVEALPEGDLLFTGHTTITVPLQDWRERKGIVSITLDISLNNPIKFIYPPHPYYPQLPTHRRTNGPTIDQMRLRSPSPNG